MVKNVLSIFLIIGCQSAFAQEMTVDMGPEPECMLTIHGELAIPYEPEVEKVKVKKLKRRITGGNLLTNS